MPYHSVQSLGEDNIFLIKFERRTVVSADIFTYKVQKYSNQGVGDSERINYGVGRLNKNKACNRFRSFYIEDTIKKCVFS
jgi:hypothetical protein